MVLSLSSRWRGVFRRAEELKLEPQRADLGGFPGRAGLPSSVL